MLNPEWSAAGYLESATGPLAGFYHALAANDGILMYYISHPPILTEPGFFRGGSYFFISMDFLARKTPGEVYQKAMALLDKTFSEGTFTLGSGNSIPNFIPMDNYMAMLSAAADFSC